MYKFRSWLRKDLEAALTTFCTASEPSEPPQSVPVDNTIQSLSELVHFLVRAPLISDLEVQGLGF